MKQSLPSPSLRALRNKSRRGFTLLEIMMVVLIMGMLVGAAVKFMGGNINIAKAGRARADIDAISTSLMSYQGLTGSLPSSAQGLQALVTQPSGDPAPKNWIQCMDKLPLDPWNNPYVYEVPGSHNNPKGYDLYSNGGNGVGQIGNWEN